VDVASSVEQAFARAGQNGYDALSLGLMSGSPGGLDVLARIREQGGDGASSVAALTIHARSGGNAAFAVADVLAKPVRADEIVAALRRFGLEHRPDIKVMIVDDDPVALELMRATLADHGTPSVSFLDGRQALAELDRHAPTAIVLDLLMPGFSGFEVLDGLRARPAWRDVPVFIWTNMVLTDSEYDLLAMSASTILRKGGGGVELLLERLRRWRPASNNPEGDVK
jgi:CheY-like chemotaxis protein